MRWVLGFVALMMVGCSSAPTQLLVFVDSDYVVPDELTEIHALVRSDDGSIAASQPIKRNPSTSGVI